MVEFTKSPTGAFMLGYNVGDKASLGAELETKLVAAGVAVPVEAETKEKPKK